MIRQQPGRRRVVVTGAGVVSALGIGTTALWKGLTDGRTGVSRITAFDPSECAVQIAAQAPVIPIEALPPEHRGLGSRLGQLLVALLEATDQADLSERSGERTGVAVAGGELNARGVGDLLAESQEAGAIVPKRLAAAIANRGSPGFDTWHHDYAAAMTADVVGATGPQLSLAAACASSTVAIGEAARLVRFGEADVMVVGGSDSRVTPIVMAQFAALGALCQDSNDVPERASRPFDVTRSGFVMGEGAGVLVLEALESAQRRGAGILGEVLGYASSCDAYRVTDPHPEGRGASIAMRAALEDASCNPSDIDYINAHGTSTKANDHAEAVAIHATLGAQAGVVPVSSFKAALGHTVQASGILETVGTLRALQTSLVPATRNTTSVDPAIALNVVTGSALSGSFRRALKNSFGFGGQNACLVLGRWPVEGNIDV